MASLGNWENESEKWRLFTSCAAPLAACWCSFYCALRFYYFGLHTMWPSSDFFRPSHKQTRFEQRWVLRHETRRDSRIFFRLDSSRINRSPKVTGFAKTSAGVQAADLAHEIQLIIFATRLIKPVCSPTQHTQRCKFIAFCILAFMSLMLIFV